MEEEVKYCNENCKYCKDSFHEKNPNIRECLQKYTVDTCRPGIFYFCIAFVVVSIIIHYLQIKN